jgi:hypothetical protein
MTFMLRAFRSEVPGGEFQVAVGVSRAGAGTAKSCSIERSTELGTPAALFRVSEPSGMFAYPYDVAPDGQRILALVASKSTGDSASLNVLVNWDAKSSP